MSDREGRGRARLDIAGTVVETVAPAELLPELMRRLSAVGSATDREPDVRLRVAEARKPGLYRWTLEVDGEVRRARARAERAALRIASDVHWAVALRPGRYLFVHSGAVAFGERLVLLPGRTHSGKSTLVATLIERGATYYSDEYALVDDDGRIHPYPRWLQLRSPGGEPGRELDPLELGCPVGDRPLRAALVVSCRFDPEVSAWRPERHGSARAVLALIDNTVRARLEPERMARVLSAAARGTMLLSGSRPEAAVVADQLLDELGRG